MIVGRYPTHIVMNRRNDRDRLPPQIDASKDLRVFSDARQPFRQDFGVEMVEMEIDMIAILADAPPLADFHRHRT